MVRKFRRFLDDYLPLKYQRNSRFIIKGPPLFLRLVIMHNEWAFNTSSTAPRKVARTKSKVHETRRVAANSCPQLYMYAHFYRHHGTFQSGVAKTRLMTCRATSSRSLNSASFSHSMIQLIYQLTSSAILPTVANLASDKTWRSTTAPTSKN